MYVERGQDQRIVARIANAHSAMIATPMA